MLENPRKFKNSSNLLLLFVKITKFLEFSNKITKNHSFFELCRRPSGVKNPPFSTATGLPHTYVVFC